MLEETKKLLRRHTALGEIDFNGFRNLEVEVYGKIISKPRRYRVSHIIGGQEYSIISQTVFSTSFKNVDYEFEKKKNVIKLAILPLDVYREG